jgi:hypothetical protein
VTKSYNPKRDWEHPALTAARKALGLRKGAPTEDDRPPPSLFPMTPAARAVMELHKRKGRVEP